MKPLTSTTPHSEAPPPPPPSSRPRRILKYKGVRKRSWGRWVAEIRVPHTRHRLWLGSFACPHQAARAYDVAAACLRGPSAARNLPSHPPPSPSTTAAASLSPTSIRSLAAQEAAHFHHDQELLSINFGSDCPSTAESRSLNLDPSSRQDNSTHHIFSHHCDSSVDNFSHPQLPHPPPIADYATDALQDASYHHEFGSIGVQSDGLPTAEVSMASPQKNNQNPMIDERRSDEGGSASASSLIDCWFSLDLSPTLSTELRMLLNRSLNRGPKSSKD